MILCFILIPSRLFRPVWKWFRTISNPHFFQKKIEKNQGFQQFPKKCVFQAKITKNVKTLWESKKFSRNRRHLIFFSSESWDSILFGSGTRLLIADLGVSGILIWSSLKFSKFRLFFKNRLWSAVSLGTHYIVSLNISCRNPSLEGKFMPTCSFLSIQNFSRYAHMIKMKNVPHDQHFSKFNIWPTFGQHMLTKLWLNFIRYIKN